MTRTLRCLAFNPNLTKLFLSSSFSFSKVRTSTSTASPNSSNFILSRYLNDTFSLPQQRALSISKRFPNLRSSEGPELVVQFLLRFGFSNSQIRSVVQHAPQVLFLDVDKVLKPKLEFFQQLGLTAPDIGKIISKNSKLLVFSLEKILIPCLSTFKKILTNDNQNNEDLVRVLQRVYCMSSNAESRLLSNIAFLESCKIVGISAFLKRSPGCFVLPESTFRKNVSRVLELGLRVESGMFVHALSVVGGMTAQTFGKKLQLFRSFGFSEADSMEMFRRCPTVFLTSEEKLKSRIGYFLNQMSDVNFERSMLIYQPYYLKFNMVGRIVPRCRVLRVIKRKRLLKKEPSFCSAFCLSEKAFLEKYVSKFGDDAQELLMAYKGDALDSSNR